MYLSLKKITKKEGRRDFEFFFFFFFFFFLRVGYKIDALAFEALLDLRLCQKNGG